MRGPSLSFDDVLLIPQYTTLASRKDADLSTQLTNGFALGIPIVSANMPAVTEHWMANEMSRLGGLGFLHRFMTIEENITQYRRAEVGMNKVGVSLGIHEGLERYGALSSVAGATIFLVDVAHADSKPVLDFVGKLKRNMLQYEYLVVGNVATAEAAVRLSEAGADAVKVGVGPGAACATRSVTGAGRGQLTAIMECAQASPVPIIADGGIRTSGDIVKALAAGASTVMLGRLLAGCDESPEPGAYWGNASHRMNGHRAPEGAEGTVPRTGSLEDTLKPLLWGIRSGISYCGATGVRDIHYNAVFETVAPGVGAESSVRI